MKFAPIALSLTLAVVGSHGQSTQTADSLPARPGVYAIDSGAQPPVQMRLHASEVRYNRHTGNNMARNSFYMNSKVTLDLAGNSAETAFTTGKVTFLVPADPESPELSLSRLTLVRLQPDNNRRILAALKANAFGGSPGRKVDSIAIAKQTLPDGNWVRVTPTVDLTPGAYAIAYFPGDPRMFPDAAYDFEISQ